MNLSKINPGDKLYIIYFTDDNLRIGFQISKVSHITRHINNKWVIGLQKDEQAFVSELKIISNNEGEQTVLPNEKEVGRYGAIYFYCSTIKKHCKKAYPVIIDYMVSCRQKEVNMIEAHIKYLNSLRKGPMFETDDQCS